jgi:hypothetical protein
MSNLELVNSRQIIDSDNNPYATNPDGRVRNRTYRLSLAYEAIANRHHRQENHLGRVHPVPPA